MERKQKNKKVQKNGKKLKIFIDKMGTILYNMICVTGN